MFCWPENKPVNMFFKLESQTCSFNRFPSGRLKLKWNYVWFMIYGSTSSLNLLCGPKIHLQFFFAVNNLPFQCVCVCVSICSRYLPFCVIPITSTTASLWQTGKRKSVLHQAFCEFMTPTFHRNTRGNP